VPSHLTGLDSDCFLPVKSTVPNVFNDWQIYGLGKTTLAMARETLVPILARAGAQLVGEPELESVHERDPATGVVRETQFKSDIWRIRVNKGVKLPRTMLTSTSRMFHLVPRCQSERHIITCAALKKVPVPASRLETPAAKGKQPAAVATQAEVPMDAEMERVEMKRGESSKVPETPRAKVTSWARANLPEGVSDQVAAEMERRRNRGVIITDQNPRDGDVAKTPVAEATTDATMAGEDDLDAQCDAAEDSLLATPRMEAIDVERPQGKFWSEEMEEEDEKRGAPTPPEKSPPSHPSTPLNRKTWERTKGAPLAPKYSTPGLDRLAQPPPFDLDVSLIAAVTDQTAMTDPDASFSFVAQDIHRTDPFTDGEPKTVLKRGADVSLTGIFAQNTGEVRYPHETAAVGNVLSSLRKVKTAVFRPTAHRHGLEVARENARVALEVLRVEEEEESAQRQAIADVKTSPTTNRRGSSSSGSRSD
jgi:hypothetical protein